MEVLRELGEIAPPGKPAVVTVGNFDGVHRGHQALVRTVMERARARRGIGVALTFDPHPQAFLHPDTAPAPLTSMRERTDLLAALGPDRLVILRFDAAFASIEAEAFVRDVLLARLGASEIYVGSNFGFGKGKKGDWKLLERLGNELSFQTSVVDSVTDAGEMISSTRIRSLLAAGDLATAAAELSRPYQIYGEVVPGEGRGRTLGFPTANVKGDKPCVLAHGVYAAIAEVAGSRHASAVNFGVKPTFGGTAPTLEAHLLDYAGGEIAGSAIRLAFLERLRGEMRFPSPTDLVAQIGRDVASARRACHAHEI
ncbi:MAG: bifunctional riboflavin kinase/FAD synthetase [Acidobacteriota bacterium]